MNALNITVGDLVKELMQLTESDRENLLAMSEWSLSRIQTVAKQAKTKENKRFMELTIAVHKLRKALVI